MSSHIKWPSAFCSLCHSQPLNKWLLTQDTHTATNPFWGPKGIRGRTHELEQIKNECHPHNTYCHCGLGPLTRALIFTTTLSDKYYYCSNFMDKETKAQRGCKTCPTSQLCNGRVGLSWAWLANTSASSLNSSRAPPVLHSPDDHRVSLHTCSHNSKYPPRSQNFQKLPKLIFTTKGKCFK